MGVSHWNAVRVSKFMLINVKINVRRLCFGGALSPAVFFEKSDFWKKIKKYEKNIYSYVW